MLIAVSQATNTALLGIIDTLKKQNRDLAIFSFVMVMLFCLGVGIFLQMFIDNLSN